MGRVCQGDLVGYTARQRQRRRTPLANIKPAPVTTKQIALIESSAFELPVDGNVFDGASATSELHAGSAQRANSKSPFVKS